MALSQTIIGRLSSDPEIRSAKDTAVLNNRVAIYNGKDKEGNDRAPTWVDITAWGNDAEYIAKNFSKGDEILLTGELRNKPFVVNKGTEDEKTFQTLYLRVSDVTRTFGQKKTNEQSISQDDEEFEME